MNYQEELKYADEYFAECKSVIESKAHDYAKSEDVMSNFKKISHILDIPTEKVFNFFIACKLARLEELLVKEANNESVHDTLIDLSNYAFLRDVYNKDK